MGTLNDSMRYPNVLHKTYRIPKDKSELAFRDFMDALSQVDIKPASLPFFSTVLSDDGQVLLHIHISMRGPVASPPKGMHFESYFYIDDMAAMTIHGDAESQMEGAFGELLEFVDSQGLMPVTPTFVLMGGEKDFLYTTLKMGYVPKPA